MKLRFAFLKFPLHSLRIEKKNQSSLYSGWAIPDARQEFCFASDGIGKIYITS